MLSSDPADRLQRARVSLEGLSVGDAFGIYCYWRNRELPIPPWYFTDDTNMALSIYCVLQESREIHQDALAESFAAHYDVERGYGPAMDDVLRGIRRGESWQRLARGLFGGSGSFGNGSAMRVAPLGAYFGDDMDALVDNARRSAEVTHAHPEGIAGAIAVAAAAGIAAQCRRSDAPERYEFIDRVMPYVPADTEVFKQVRRARDLAPYLPVATAVASLGNGSQVTCQDTVPFVLWCAGSALHDYEEALWLTASAGGDRDTTCAMVGGIVACYTGIESIPAEWRARREVLPAWAVGEDASSG
jgi:ADP-ribosylglycohydrolase